MNELKDTEENLPRRDLPKRGDKSLDTWADFHEAMFDSFLQCFYRNIRREIQDAQAMIEMVGQLDKLRTDLENIRRAMEKWTTYVDLKPEQVEQKKLDGAREIELADMV